LFFVIFINVIDIITLNFITIIEKYKEK